MIECLYIKTEDGSGNTIFADNEKVIFGAGSDLQIYHDSNNSYIAENGTGSLYIRGTNLIIQDTEGNDYLTCVDSGTGGTVTLKHETSTKLATTSSGIDVTGTAVTDGLTVAGNVSIDGGTIKLDGNYPVGNFNTALGDTALDSITDGSGNVAVGHAAVTALTSGTLNTGVGYISLDANTTGSANTAIGAGSLGSNTTASNNTAVGYSALTANTTGASLVAVGQNALANNTTASNNTAVGQDSLFTLTTGTGNVALGTASARLMTIGNYNVAIGLEALKLNTTSSNNTAVGYQAMYSYQTGGDNVALGTQAGYSINGNGNATFIGRSAGYSTTGGNNTFIGRNSGSQITTGSGNTIVGRYQGNSGGLDIRTASNHIVLSDGDGNPRAYFVANGDFYCPRVYAQTTGTGANVAVNSNGILARSTSSLRYKNTINNATHGLTELLTLRPVTYKSNNDGDTIFGGLIAEEVHDAGLTEFVQYNDDGEPDALAYGNMASLCIKAIQELKTELDSAKARIATLEGA